MKKTNALLTTLIVLSLHLFSAAQDIDALLKATPLTVSGGVNVSTSFYDNQGGNSVQPPFFYTVGANLNLNFFGVVSAPFSFRYSPAGDQFSYPTVKRQPFNQLGISPKYKWLKVHLGYRSMAFSPYTYSGTKFYGAGVEVTPKKLKFHLASFYGRLAKGLSDSIALSNPDFSIYDRFGGGIKAGYGKKDRIEFILFNAFDRYNDLLDQELTAINTPKSNTVVGVNLQKSFKGLNFKFEYALSAMNQDVRIREQNFLGDQQNWLYQLLAFPGISTTYSNAINSSLGYKFKQVNTQLKYRRIDPNYQTLGIPFLNNDMEDITLNVGVQLLKSKMNVSMSGGLQRNNLANDLLTTTLRLIGSIDVGYSINEYINIGANHSNFTTNTTKIKINGLDSLNYYQVTENTSLTAAFKFGKKKVTQGISTNASYQKAVDIQRVRSDVYNFQTAYTMAFGETGINSAVGVNVNKNHFVGIESLGVGPTASIAIPFFNKKLRSSMNFSMLEFRSNGLLVNKSLNAGAQLRYSYKIHSFGLSYTFLQRQVPANKLEILEHRASLTYSMSLKAHKFEFKKNKNE